MLLATLVPLALSLSPALSDGDWPGWRGARGTGVASGSPPVEWSEEKNVRWRTEIPGKGNSSPVVFGDLVFVTTAVATEEPKAPEEPEGGGAEGGDDEGGPPRGRGERGGRGGRGGFGGPPLPAVEHDFLVLALDRADGSVVWEHVASTQTPHESSHADGSFASPTLVTDGQRVIASFGSFGLYAYDMTGEPLWSKDLGDMSISRAFGEGSSPVLRDGTLVVPWEHEGDSFVVALDAKSGEERWRHERPRGTSWASPLVLEADGGPLVVVSGPLTVAYELASGAERWRYGEAPEPTSDPRGGGGGGNIASPVVYEDVLVLLTGGRRGGFEAIAVAPDAKGTLERDSARLWLHDGDAPHVPSPLAHDGILYALKGNSGVLVALDLSTGETLYSQRLEGVQNVYASPVLADGHLYLAGRDGAVEVVAAGPEFESLAVNRLDDAFDASPAVAGDELFLRGRRHVYCVAAKDDAGR